MERSLANPIQIDTQSVEVACPGSYLDKWQVASNALQCKKYCHYPHWAIINPKAVVPEEQTCIQLRPELIRNAVLTRILITKLQLLAYRVHQLL